MCQVVYDKVGFLHRHDAFLKMYLGLGGERLAFRFGSSINTQLSICRRTDQENHSFTYFFCKVEEVTNYLILSLCSMELMVLEVFSFLRSFQKL